MTECPTEPRRICVCLEFLSDNHRRSMREAAERCGFEVAIFESEDDPALPSYLAQSEVLFAHSPALLRQAPPTLRWYCCAYAGVDPYCADPTLFANPDCLLSNSSGAYDETIGEHLVMAVLMLLRRMPEYIRIAHDRGWERDLPVRSIREVRIAVLGAGNIGSAFAEKAVALGARGVVGVSRSGRAREPFSDVLAIDGSDGKGGLDGLLPRVDVLVMALPGTAQTAGVLSRERIALLPPGALVVNVGRGSAIDQEALAEALNDGCLGGAALDVMVPEPLPADDPLWSARNILITPHVSGNMTMGYTRDEAVRLFCEDLENYAAGRPLARLVDRAAGY